MIDLDKTLISLDVVEKEFVCNLSKCKGACCVEGDLGAPLDFDELSILEEIYPVVKPYLLPEGVVAIEENGTWVIDDFNEYSTPLVNNKACAYVNYDQDGTLKCAIEQAHKDEKIAYKKPISCHLYPIRLSQLKELIAVNYDKWSICSDACVLGKELQVPVYKFLKEPLIRKFGSTWYKQLEDWVAANYKV
jgi:Protein of unknown function (DUF3109)